MCFFISFCLFLSLFGVLFWFRVMFLVSHRNNLEWNIFQKCQRITYFLHQWNELGVHTLYLSQEKNNKHFGKALFRYGSWCVFLCIEYKQIRNHACINPKNVNNLRRKNAKALSRGTTTKRNTSFEETSLTVQLLSQWYIFEYKVMLVKNEKVQTPH